MAAKVPDIYQESLYTVSLLDMPEPYKVLAHFLEIDGDCVPNWENMPRNERKECIREIILDEFPKEREEIERCIRDLRVMADAIDETHRTCTLANLAASSTSASSGILSILGMSLAPFTAGGSLILTTAGLGLGAVAALTSFSANLYEHASTSKETEKAQLLMDLYREQFRIANCLDETNFDSEFPTNNKTLEKNNQNLAPKIASTALSMYKTAKKIKANVKALKCAQANTGFKGLVSQATEKGKAIWGKIWGAKQAEKAFTGTSFAMSKGARLLGAATAGAFVLFDAYNIAQDAKHLQEGAKAETAAEIREKARKLEEELQELIKLYEEVQIDHYLRQCQATLGCGRSPTVSFCDGQPHILPTRPQQPTQINGAATTKPTRASSVGQHSMQQTLMGSPQGFPSVGGSSSLQPACQQRLTVTTSTISQWSQNQQDNQVEGAVFQGVPQTPTDERWEGNTGARELSELTLDRAKKGQVRTRRPVIIKHSPKADEELSWEVARLANSVAQHPKQQTLMCSPHGVQTVGGSGFLQPSCQKQRFTAAASTFSQRSWDWQDKQVQGIDFQGGPQLTDERGEGNTRAIVSSEVTSDRVKKEQGGTRRLLEIKHSLMANDTQENQIEGVVFQRVTHTPTDRRREGNTEARELSGNTLSRGRKEQDRTRRPLDIKQSQMVDEKLRLARSVDHHPTQQMLMGLPLDFQSVVGSGSPQLASQQQRPIAASSIISWQSSKWQDNQVEGAVFQRVTHAPIDGKKDSNTGVSELSEHTSGRARKEQRGTRRPLDRKHSPMAQDNQVEGTVFQGGTHTPTDGSWEGNLRAKEFSEHASYRIRKRQGGTRRPPDIKNSLVANDSKGNKVEETFPRSHLRYTPIDGRQGGNTRARELSQHTSDRVRKEQQRNRRPLEINHSLLADELSREAVRLAALDPQA